MMRARAPIHRLAPRLLWTAALGAALLAAGAPLAGGSPRGDKPARGEKQRRKAAVEEGSREVFDPAPVLRLRIDLPPDSIASLEKDRHTYVPAFVREGDAAAPLEVGVHLKGSAGSERPLSEKSGMTLKFDRYADHRRFHGLRKLVLNNAVQDPTYLSDLLGGELFRGAGVPAPRIGFARVELNGRDLGLFVVVEAITRDFLARWFEDPTGNLYEGPGDVDNPQDVDVDSRSGFADRADLKELMAAAAEPDPARRLARLGELLDLDRFYSYLALETITWDWDGYPMAANNYHLYHDPRTRRFVFFPHGIDQLFQDPGAPAYPQFTAVVARQVLRTSAGRKAYRERLQALLPRALDVGALHRRISEAAARIRAVLAQVDPEQARAHDEAVASLIGRIAERSKSLREQIEKGEPQPPKPIEFDGAGIARPSGWEPRPQLGEPELARIDDGAPGGGPALSIAAPGTGDPAEARCGSFRTRVVLGPGSYRLRGRVRTRGVEPIPRSEEEGERLASGVCLRISGRQPAEKLLGSRDWAPVEFEFTVEPGEAGEGGEGEPAILTVELVCELRASRGTALFDEKSLELHRLGGRPPEK